MVGVPFHSQLMFRKCWGKCQMCLPFVCKRKWYEFCGKYPNMCFIWKMTSVNLLDTNKEKLFIAGPFVLSQVLFTTAIIYDGLTKLKSEHEPIGPCSLPFWFNCSLFLTNLLLTCQYERLFPVCSGEQWVRWGNAKRGARLSGANWSEWWPCSISARVHGKQGAYRTYQMAEKRWVPYQKMNIRWANRLSYNTCGL